VHIHDSSTLIRTDDPPSMTHLYGNPTQEAQLL
jgi:hypothetical protein